MATKCNDETTPIKPISYNKIKQYLKILKEKISEDPEEYGHLNDNQLLKAMGIVSSDTQFYIKIGGNVKKNKKTIKTKINKKKNKRARKTIKKR
jgi:hypothetical protein